MFLDCLLFYTLLHTLVETFLYWSLSFMVGNHRSFSKLFCYVFLPLAFSTRSITSIDFSVGMLSVSDQPWTQMLHMLLHSRLVLTTVVIIDLIGSAITWFSHVILSLTLLLLVNARTTPWSWDTRRIDGSECDLAKYICMFWISTLVGALNRAIWAKQGQVTWTPPHQLLLYWFCGRITFE